MISDGILPSNEGRGYVLRRLLRRAARHGKLLGLNESFLHLLMEQVVDKFKAGYPELEEKQEMIRKVILVEEERFQETIHQGTEILNNYIKEIKSVNMNVPAATATASGLSPNVLSGKQAFRLYDTFGFPLDLTKEILEEEGMEVDEPGFKAEMEQQKQRARTARSESGTVGWKDDPLNGLLEVPVTVFKGYETLEMTTTVAAIIQEGKKYSSAATRRTPADHSVRNAFLRGERRPGGRPGNPERRLLHRPGH
jgi:alanyl-tRNA synthetase